MSSTNIIPPTADEAADQAAQVRAITEIHEARVEHARAIRRLDAQAELRNHVPELMAFVHGDDTATISRAALLALLWDAYGYGYETRDHSTYAPEAQAWAYLLGYLQLTDEVKK